MEERDTIWTRCIGSFYIVSPSHICLFFCVSVFIYISIYISYFFGVFLFLLLPLSLSLLWHCKNNSFSLIIFAYKNNKIIHLTETAFHLSFLYLQSTHCFRVRKDRIRIQFFFIRIRITSFLSRIRIPLFILVGSNHSLSGIGTYRPLSEFVYYIS